MTDKPQVNPGDSIAVSDLKKQEDGTVSFTMTIPISRVKSAYRDALAKAVSETELKGFRKGKAPANLVESQVGKQKLYTDTLTALLPRAYNQAVSQLNLKPFTSPRVEPVSLEEEKDWILSVTVAEKPVITLGDYRKFVSDSLASAKIWTPGNQKGIDPQKTRGQAQSPQATSDEKLGKIFAALLKAIEVKLPSFLIEEEARHKLSNLVEQLEKLKLTVDHYLASVGKTSESLQAEYRSDAERTLKLELILGAIADDLKVNVTEEEVDKLIQAVGDPQLRENLNTPSERAAIRATLRKRKVVDQLLHL